jgi:phage-related minor tail protein
VENEKRRLGTKNGKTQTRKDREGKRDETGKRKKEDNKRGMQTGKRCIIKRQKKGKQETREDKCRLKKEKKKREKESKKRKERKGKETYLSLKRFIFITVHYFFTERAQGGPKRTASPLRLKTYLVDNHKYTS